MKRMLSFCLSVLLLFALSACGKQQAPPEMSETPPASSEPVQAEQLEETEPEKEEDDTMQQPGETVSNTVEGESKILIAYFSLVDIVPEGADASAHTTPAIGNTEAAAMEIQRQVGGDLFAIKTVQTYPVSHRECSAIAEEEMRSDARPELSTHVENMADYDTIYIGYPIWWYIEPMAVRTFLEEYDLSGKTVIPFCTTLGAGVEESEDNMKLLCPDSTILDGLTLHTGRDSFADPISEWLADIGVTE